MDGERFVPVFRVEDVVDLQIVPTPAALALTSAHADDRIPELPPPQRPKKPVVGLAPVVELALLRNLRSLVDQVLCRDPWVIHSLSEI